MSKWDTFYKTVERTANKAVRKTEEITDSATMHIKLKSIASKLSVQYEHLGKLTYKQMRSNRSYAGEIADIVDEIDALRTKAKEIKEKIEKAKEDREEEKKKNAEFDAEFETIFEEEAPQTEETEAL